MLAHPFFPSILILIFQLKHFLSMLLSEDVIRQYQTICSATAVESEF